MRVGNEDLVNPVIFLGGRGLLAPAAALLSAVFIQRLALDVTRVAERDHHVGGGDEVFRGQVLRIGFDGGAAHAFRRLAKFGFQRRQLVANDGRDARRAGQNVQQVFNLRHDLLVFGHDLVLLKARETLQVHLQNFLRLRV